MGRLTRRDPGAVRVATLVVLVAACAAACVARAPERRPRPFDFASDSFAFANETLLEFHVADDGSERWTERDPRPAFSLRCAPVTRAVRQFFLEARFAPDAPPLDDEGYRALARAVLARSPRDQEPSADPVVIPGYPNLRSFSAAREVMLKQEISSSWRIFFQRANWRLIFPFTPSNQEATAEELRRDVEAGRTPIVRVHRYPSFAMNHALLLYGVEDAPVGLRFRAYDPNDADAPVTFEYDRVARTFTFPKRVYFGGGPVKVYEMYHGPFY